MFGPANGQHALQRRVSHRRGPEQPGFNLLLEWHQGQHRATQPRQQGGAQNADRADVRKDHGCCQACLCGCPFDDGAHPVGAGRQDQRERQHVLQSNALGQAHCVLNRFDQVHAFAQQGRVLKVGQMTVVKQNGEVDLSGDQLPGEIACELFGQFKLDGGKLPSDLPQQCQRQGIGRAVRDAENHLARGLAGGRARTGDGFLGLPQDGHRMRQKSLARLSQLDALAGAMKQAGANLFFELGCLMAQGGLRNKDPVGRLGERAALGNGNEIPQLTKFHGVVTRNGLILIRAIAFEK